MKKFWLVLMALMVLVGCVSAEGVTPEEEEAPFTVVEENGQYFLEVIGNPSTGYVWTVFSIVGDVVNVLDPTAVETADEVAGAPVTYRIAVEAVNAGETILVLRYMRPWEMAIDKEIPVLVTVDENKEMFFMQLEGMPMAATVVEVMAEEHMVLVENETLGQVICTFPAEMPLPQAGENIKIWFNGVMALSFPGRINVLGWETVAPPQARVE